MNGVIGMTGLLLDSDLNDIQRHHAEAALASAESLLQIINDILDFSKIEAGKLVLEKIDFEPEILFSDICATVALGAQAKGIELLSWIEPDVPPQINGDPNRLRQILLNLVGNAVKFTPAGEILIQVENISHAEDEICLRFAVRDTGIGIAKDKQLYLFEKFSQVDTSITRQFGGTGLGLTIAKQLVDLMGGEIGVCSEVGKGSEFWFTLPFPRPVSCQAETDPPYPAGIRVLIVDDNAASRAILGKTLKGWGIGSFAVEDGLAALHELHRASREQEPYEWVLLDLLMPKLDGEIIGRMIRDDPQLKNLRLLLMVPVEAKGRAEKFQEIGFAASLTKPLRSKELRQVLRLARDDQCFTPSQDDKFTASGYYAVEDLGKYFGERKIRILLVEDNLTNQEVASSLLIKMGLSVDVAVNGREAITSLKSAVYDLVLMDCQMPVMDGYEAVRQIRNPATGVTNPEILIIAMTAQALQGDREKCLAAGMNDYLPKPIMARDLTAKIKKWLLNDVKDIELEFSGDSIQSDREIEFSTTTPAQLPVWDLAELLARSVGDKALVARLVEVFLVDLGQEMQALEEKISAQDLAGARFHSHTIKGMAANIAAERLRDAAAALEKISAAGDSPALHPALTNFKKEVEQLKTVMQNQSISAIERKGS